jgi:hypothetical protein
MKRALGRVAVSRAAAVTVVKVRPKKQEKRFHRIDEAKGKPVHVAMRLQESMHEQKRKPASEQSEWEVHPIWTQSVNETC